MLEQHHLDLIGWAWSAFSAFLAFVLYMGAAGGQAGEAVEDGLRFLLGGAALLAPPALCATGVVLVLRQMLPSIKPFRAGRAVPAAGNHPGPGRRLAGPGARAPTPTRRCSSPPMSATAAARWASCSTPPPAPLFSDLGAHILFLFLVTGGVLLLTGASIAGVVATAARLGDRHHPSRCAAPPSR